MPKKSDEEIRKSIKHFEESLPESERNPDTQEDTGHLIERAAQPPQPSIYAMTGKLQAQPGKRAVLVDILLRASKVVSTMRGCRSYIVLEDVQDESAVWVFEMWDDKESHDASLRDEQVKGLIAEAMPILAGAPSGSELRVAGGHGINL
jgi:quinol monooxygenase YgiN